MCRALSLSTSLPVFFLSPDFAFNNVYSTRHGWAQGSFVEAEAEVKAERSRQRRGKAAMSLTEARQGRGRELEAKARQTKFEA